MTQVLVLKSYKMAESGQKWQMMLQKVLVCHNVLSKTFFFLKSTNSAKCSKNLTSQKKVILGKGGGE